jgi:hypothetical protein
LIDICDMEPLDAHRTRASSKPRKWDENVIWELNHVAVAAKDSRVILDVFRISDGHQKRRLISTAPCSLKMIVVRFYMLGHVCFVIVPVPASLVEQGGETSLKMTRVRLGCYYASSVIRATTSARIVLQESYDNFNLHSACKIKMP